MAQQQPYDDIAIWDRVYLPSTTSALQVPMFTTPANNPDPQNSSGGAKTRVDTNMSLVGQLPNPQSFRVDVIRFGVDFGTAEADTIKIMNTSYLQFISNGGQTFVAWEGPTKLVPAGTGFQYSTNNQAQVGFGSPTATFMLKRPIIIGVQEGFMLLLNFSAVPSFSAAVKVWAIFEGERCNILDPTRVAGAAQSLGLQLRQAA